MENKTDFSQLLSPFSIKGVELKTGWSFCLTSLITGAKITSRPENTSSTMKSGPGAVSP